MFRAFAAFALASASALAAASSPATLNPSAPWWERVTVLVANDGQAQSCRYESSLQPTAGKECSVEGATATAAKAGEAGSGSKSEFTRITFERRFSPGTKVDMQLQPGETLLGGRVMALAIDGKGAVKDCQVVATSGSVTPQYGCADIAAERFEASAATGPASSAQREGYMSIIVYGHSEHMV